MKKTKNYSLDALSDIQYTLSTYEFTVIEKKWNTKSSRLIQIFSFSGVYRIGSEGFNDAKYMNAIYAAFSSICNFYGTVFDFSKLKYEWGNDLANVILAPKIAHKKNFPVACVVSGMNRAAIEGLKPFFVLKEYSPSDYKWLHDDLDEAIDYVEKQIT